MTGRDGLRTPTSCKVPNVQGSAIFVSQWYARSCRFYRLFEVHKDHLVKGNCGDDIEIGRGLRVWRPHNMYRGIVHRFPVPSCSIENTNLLTPKNRLDHHYYCMPATEAPHGLREQGSKSLSDTVQKHLDKNCIPSSEPTCL